MLKRIYRILNKQLDRVEERINNTNNSSSKTIKESEEFKKSLNIKVSQSSKRVDNLRKSIQNTKL